MDGLYSMYVLKQVARSLKIEDLQWCLATPLLVYIKLNRHLVHTY